MKHRAVSTGNQWEKRYGYARAVRAGSTVCCTGTVAINPDGSPHAPNDAYAQAARCFEIIEKAFKELGATKENIIRTRMFVTDIARADDFGRAHKDFFQTHSPCLTMVEVARLIDDSYLIEIEADAVVGD
ncbi:MAG: RidA family protein [Phycisphaerales bacterium]|nr:RidA family protein [Phycisphaerales bacterium]